MQKVKVWGFVILDIFFFCCSFSLFFLHKVRNGDILWFSVIFIFLRPQKRAYVAETPKYATKYVQRDRFFHPIERERLKKDPKRKHF